MCVVPESDSKEFWTWKDRGFFHDCTQIVQSVLGSFSPSSRCLFLDVGANMGCIGLSLAQQNFNVIALEPAKQSASLIRGAVAKNRLETRMRVVEAAAGAVSGSSVLRCPTHPQNTLGECTLGVLDKNFIFEYTEKEVVQVALNDLVKNIVQKGKKVCGIKMDVEGNEEEALRGAGAVLSLRPTMYIDIHDVMLRQRGRSAAGVWDVLSSFGYRRLVDYSNVDCWMVGGGRWMDFRWQGGSELDPLLTLTVPPGADRCFCLHACAARMSEGCRCWEVGRANQSKGSPARLGTADSCAVVHVLFVTCLSVAAHVVVSTETEGQVKFQRARWIV